MCGLVGIAGDINLKEKEFFKNLLVASSMRGVHGTGVASVSIHAKIVDWAKIAGHVYDLMEYKHFDKCVSTAQKLLIGHNRYATRGGHTNSNTHPFEFDNIIGAHNGTIETWSVNKLKDHDKYGTDSQALYATIDDWLEQGYPIEDAVKNTLKVIEGAWALTFYDRKTDRIGFIRNKDRPLCFCTLEDKKLIAWASESWMLWSLAARNQLKIDDKVFSFTEDTLYMFDFPNKMGEQFPEPKRTKAEGKSKTDWSFMGGTHKSSGSASHGTSETNVVKIPPKRQTFPNENQNKKTNFRNPYKDAHGHILNKDAFNALIKLGNTCCYCNAHQPVWGEQVCFLRPAPTGAPQYLCKQCINDDQVMHIMQGMR